MKAMAEIKTPYQYGKEAFEKGIKLVPILDKAFFESGTEINKTTLKEWIRGWVEANLKAEE